MIALLSMIALPRLLMAQQSAGDGAQSFKSAADPAQPRNVRFFGSNANGQI
jgi:hypothetical protein